MQDDLPIFESPEEALRAAVQHMGGAKVVGPLLWPDRAPDHAARLLLDCLNHDRAEKLAISQLMMIMRMARDRGYHAAMIYFANDCGYDAHPVTRAEEVDRATAAVEQASKALAAGLATLERLQRTKVRAA